MKGIVLLIREKIKIFLRILKRSLNLPNNSLHQKGFFITFEGIEGSGKSTHIEQLGYYLKSLGFNVILTKEPGGTNIGHQIRKILLDPKNTKLNSFSELFLLLADRSQHVREVVLPALKKKYIVISDRYSDSTLAYQSSGRNIKSNLINNLNNLATFNLKPNITFLLETPLTQAIKRVKYLSKEYKGGDRIENETILFHKRVFKEYHNLWLKNKSRIIKIKIKDNIQSTQNEIRKITLLRLKKLKII